MTSVDATDIQTRTRTIEAGAARSAVFRRFYAADIDDVWDACTNPERLARWYAPVSGDLREGGSFDQGDFGSGRVARCEAPRNLVIELGGASPATDVVYLSLTPDGDGTMLQFEHATTLDTHEISGYGVFDAVYCMGGGYPPRLETLQRELAGEIPPGHDPSQLHLDPAYRDFIDDGMARLGEQLAASGVARELLGGAPTS